MRLLPVILFAVATAAHAQSDDVPLRTHATLFPCPNGPGVAVVADQPDGSQEWAGCWGSDAPVQDDYHRDDRRSHTLRK
jgi:hypothetical protein